MTLYPPQNQVFLSKNPLREKTGGKRHKASSVIRRRWRRRRAGGDGFDLKQAMKIVRPELNQTCLAPDIPQGLFK